MRALAALIVLLVALVALAAVPMPPAAAQATLGQTYVNVVTARSLGCSPDVVTSPDLRVTVFMDGRKVLQTAKGQDQDAPLYAQLATVATPSSPVQVQLQVEEAEPGGFFLLGTSWVPCDTADGPDTLYAFSWDGSHRSVVARGDGENAAEATVVFGPDAPAPPEPAATDVQAYSATLAWASSGMGHRVAWGGVGSVMATLPPGTSTYRMDGLCENSGYTVRVVRDLDPWHVGSADVRFTTANLPPRPPQVLSADPSNGTVDVHVDLPTSHDLARLDLFGGPGANVSMDGEPVASATWGFDFGDWSGTVDGNLTYVAVRVTDTGGLSVASPSFQVGSAHRGPGTHVSCNGTAVDPVDPWSSPDAGTDDNGPGSPGWPGEGDDGSVSDPRLGPDGLFPPRDGATEATEGGDEAGGSWGLQPAWLPWIVIGVFGAVLLGIVIGLALRR